MMLWIVFAALVVIALILDLGVLGRRAHVIGFKEAIGRCAAWFGLAFAFSWVVYFWKGHDDALAFMAGYLVEWSLSVDNIFVFLVIFSYFSVPETHQHKVLFWGILGAVIMRAALIAAGVVLIGMFHWIIYVFGGFLVLTGAKLLVHRHEDVQPDRNPVLRLARRWLPLADQYHGQRFFVRIDGRLRATPLFIVLLAVETTDVVFAVDSVPAVLAITTDPFIVYTSNVFAILGLRALYFALAGVMRLFRFLRYGLAAILVFVGVKMILSDTFHLPTAVALGGVLFILLVSIAASLLFKPRDAGSTDVPI
jgi:tellurite resistance protein TerC